MSRDFRVSLQLLSMSYEPYRRPEIDDLIGKCSKPFEKQLTESETDVKLSTSYEPYCRPEVDSLIGKCSKPFEKQLTETDVNPHQCRLSISKKDVEKAVTPLLKEGEDAEKGIPVKVYDADRNEYPMKLIYWSKKINVLKEGWTEFCTQHGLLAHQDLLTLQAFRHVQTDELCFLITSRRTEVFKPMKKRKTPEP